MFGRTENISKNVRGIIFYSHILGAVDNLCLETILLLPEDIAKSGNVKRCEFKMD